MLFCARSAMMSFRCDFCLWNRVDVRLNFISTSNLIDRSTAKNERKKSMSAWNVRAHRYWSLCIRAEWIIFFTNASKCWPAKSSDHSLKIISALFKLQFDCFAFCLYKNTNHTFFEWAKTTENGKKWKSELVLKPVINTQRLPLLQRQIESFRFEFHDFFPSFEGDFKGEMRKRTQLRSRCVCVKESKTLWGLESQPKCEAKQSTQKLQFDLCWSLAHWESPANKWLGSVFLICLFYTWKIETKWYFGVQKEK